MLRNIDGLLGYKVLASDGEIGEAKDFYFDDEGWGIRYLLVETSRWPEKHHVVIAPAAFKKPDTDHRRFLLNVSGDMVRHSPDLDASLPIPQAYEDELAQYYRWPVYWTPAHELLRLSGRDRRQLQTAIIEDEIATRQLLTAGTVTGFAVQATDGPAGTVNGFIIDDIFWDIRYVALRLTGASGGQDALIDPQWVQGILPDQRRMDIGLLRGNLRPGTTYDFRDESRPEPPPVPTPIRKSKKVYTP